MQRAAATKETDRRSLYTVSPWSNRVIGDLPTTHIMLLSRGRMPLFLKRSRRRRQGFKPSMTQIITSYSNRYIRGNLVVPSFLMGIGIVSTNSSHGHGG